MSRNRWMVGLALLVGFALAAPAAATSPPPGPWPARIGVEVQNLTPELREHLGAPEDRGVLVARVAKDRPASRAGVRVGDVLTRAGEAPLASPADLVRAVAAVPEGETLELELVREGRRKKLEVTPEGAAWPLAAPSSEWHEWLREGMRLGRDELRRRLDDLERRLEELERQLDEMETPGKAT